MFLELTMEYVVQYLSILKIGLSDHILENYSSIDLYKSRKIWL